MNAVLERVATHAKTSELVAYVERALAKDGARAETLAVAIPVAASAPDEILSAELEAESFLWDPPAGEGDRFAGFGAARRIDASGPDRFREVARAADRIFERLVVRAHDEVPRCVPRFFGGFAFEDDPGPTWKRFGAASFTLPRWTLAVPADGSRAALVLAIAGSEARSNAHRALAELEAILARIASSRGAEPLPEITTVLTEPALAGWAEQLAAIQEELASGRAEKIVASRRTWVVAKSAWPHRAVIARLGEGSNARARSARFAFHRGGSTFLGLTPERLVVKRGAIARSEAVAGTVELALVEDLRELATAKSEVEHSVVVRHVRERLASIGGEVARAVPEVRRLGHLAHLVTPISAELGAGVHVLDVAGALHPTPAVAGAPAQVAAEWIASRETHARGWYAGPVGWFDARGDGELFVALRCALLHERSALLAAGAGIVAASDPIAEYREARLKERTMRIALGAEP